MKIKTADLIDLALDWAVATCDGYEYDTESGLLYSYEEPHFFKRYSSDWSQGGPLIEREGINLFKHNKLSESQPDTWCAHKVVPRPNLEGSFNSCALAPEGPTALIAGMRCVVASRLGDEVDVPDELV